MTGSQLSHLHPQDLLSRLRAYVRTLCHSETSQERAGSPSDPVNVPDPDVPAPADLSIPELLPADPAASCALLYELTSQLRSWLPCCRWLEEGTIKFVGDRPVDAGEVANIYLGMRGNRKVIVKCYRFYPSSDYFPTYMVGVLSSLCVFSSSLKIHRQRFRQEALACGRFRNQSFVPFIGIYSTPQYPMCLVFEHMDHSNLEEYLRKNKHVGRCELVRFSRHIHCSSY